MDVPAYTYVVVCMVALSAVAAFGALVLALGQLRPRAPARRGAPRRPMAFDLTPAAPAPMPSAAPVRAAPEPAPRPAPAATLVFSAPPPAPSRRRLDLALMSARAPERLRVPVDLARGRILELNLPLLLANAGEEALEDVSIQLILPNEITYGASLERLARDGAPGLPGSRISYALSEHETHIRIDVARLEPGDAATAPVPISIKHAADAAYRIRATGVAGGIEPVQRRYELELLDRGAQATGPDTPEVWTCRPDEQSRQRDPFLPLDRIASMRFAMFEPDSAESMPMRPALPAYEPLRL